MLARELGLDARENLRDPLTLRVFDHEPDAAGAAEREVSRGGPGRVGELLNDLGDARAHLGARVAAVDDVRHGALRDARVARHLGDVGATGHSLPKSA